MGEEKIPTYEAIGITKEEMETAFNVFKKLDTDIYPLITLGHKLAIQINKLEEQQAQLQAQFQAQLAEARAVADEWQQKCFEIFKALKDTNK